MLASLWRIELLHLCWMLSQENGFPSKYSQDINYVFLFSLWQASLGLVMVSHWQKPRTDEEWCPSGTLFSFRSIHLSLLWTCHPEWQTCSPWNLPKLSIANVCLWLLDFASAHLCICACNPLHSLLLKRFGFKHMSCSCPCLLLNSVCPYAIKIPLPCFITISPYSISCFSIITHLCKQLK